MDGPYRKIIFGLKLQGPAFNPRSSVFEKDGWEHWLALLLLGGIPGLTFNLKVVFS